MDISEVKGFDYKEYRRPIFERFISSYVYVVEWISTVMTTLLLSAMVGWAIAITFPFIYDLVHRMKKHSIYFYDNKGIGPSMLEIFLEDLVRAIRSAVFCVIIARCISLVVNIPVATNTTETENVNEVQHESNTECGDKHEV